MARRDLCIDMCTDMYRDTCRDMCTDMYRDMCTVSHCTVFFSPHSRCTVTERQLCLPPLIDKPRAEPDKRLGRMKLCDGTERRVVVGRGPQALCMAVAVLVEQCNGRRM